MNQYILIKLRSGEEIIASLMSKNRTGTKIMRPMQIKQIPFMDHITGSMKAAVVFENWIGRTNDNEVVIPNNWIGIKMLPSQEVIDAYERQMKFEDAPPQPSARKEELTEKEQNELQQLEDEMTRMLSGMLGGSPGQTMPEVGGLDAFSQVMGDQGKKDTVIVNFMFPSNVFKNMMEEGLIEDFISAGLSYQDDNGDDSFEDDDLEDDVDPKKPKKIRENNIDFKEKEDEPWGNSFRDWSSNPNDYL